MSITWELVRNAELPFAPQTYWIRTKSIVKCIYLNFENPKLWTFVSQLQRRGSPGNLVTIPLYSLQTFLWKKQKKVWAFTLGKMLSEALRYENEPDTWLWVLRLVSPIPEPFVEQQNTLGTGVPESSAGGEDRSEGVRHGAKWSPVHSESIDSSFTNHAFWGCPEESSQHYPSLQEGNFPRNCPLPWRHKKLQSFYQLSRTQAHIQATLIPLCLGLWGSWGSLLWRLWGFSSIIYMLWRTK